jgi:hypothetical protein
MQNLNGKNISELIEKIRGLENDCWIYENTVKKLLERAEAAESACAEAARIINSGERLALTRAVNILISVGVEARSNG